MPNPYYIFNAEPLLRAPLAPLPLGAIEPRGWLRDQLEIQAAGLTGHLDEVWPSVGPDSGWLGGAGENWERGPYYCDGLVPLAYLLRDEALIAKARAWLEWSLQSQTATGQFGPAANPDWWPRMVMLKALLQYQEATDDPRVIPFMQRYFRYQAAQIESQPLEDWATARGGDNLYALYWLYNRTREPFLLDLAATVYRQTLDWANLLSDFPYTRPIAFYYDWNRLGEETSSQEAMHEIMHYHTHHVVDVAMGIKAPGLFFQQSGDERQREAVWSGIENLMRYHGQPGGVWSGDEHLSGRVPTQGTELCSVVEFMFSLQTLLPFFADVALADALEKAAYNALPAAITPDGWAHQYVQQANQVLVSLAPRNWYNNGDDANLFGLEPNFGCCTANMHQGWPKFVKNLWLATIDGGLAALAYAPCTVRARVAGGVEVEITEETGYPFREEITFTLRCPQPVEFPLVLRVPGWCDRATARINRKRAQKLVSGHLQVMVRRWTDGDRVTLTLPMALRTMRWDHEAISIERGPLVFSLRVAEEWRRLRGADPCPDWEVYPASPWNYGLCLDPDHPERALTVEERPLTRQPFSAEPPVLLHGRGRRLPAWTLQQNSAGPVPPSPVVSSEPCEEVTLVPYGAAKLRVTELPFTPPRSLPLS